MPGFINRLAGRTLGALPLAEPIIPARFTPEPRRHDLPLWTLELDSVHKHMMTASEAAFPDPATDTAAPTERQRRPSKIDKLMAQDNAQSPLATNMPVIAETRPAEAQNISRSGIHPVPQSTDASGHDKLIAPLLSASSPERAEQPPTRIELLAQPRAIVPPPAEEAPSPAAHSSILPPVRIASATPTVRVTIGRIDVRADLSVQSQPAPQTRTRRAPLSLDQFLTQSSSRGSQ
jgi:hypothetical protein